MKLAKATLVVVLFASCLALCNSEPTENHVSPPEQENSGHGSADPTGAIDSRVAAETSPSKDDESPLDPSETRTQPATPMNFQQFKRTFGRHYNSIIEELRRQKLFLARYLRSKLSWLKFWAGEEKSFLGINRMSDWTEDERASTKNKVLSEEEEPAAANRVEQKQRGEAGADAKLPADRKKREVDSDDDDDDDDDDDRYRRGRRAILKAGQTGLKKFSKMFKSRAGSDEQYDRKSLGYDLRTTKCFNEPIHQGHCGSCYAITAVAMYEYLFCRLHEGKLPKFSEQYIVDCGHKQLTGLEMKGCEGGRVSAAAEFAHEMGFEQSKDFPYVGHDDGQCPYQLPNSKKLNKKAAGFLKFYNSDLIKVEEDEYEKYLRKKIPVYLSIQTEDQSFFEYGGGVDSGEDCAGGDTHAVLLVGSGVEKGREYWLMRNSFGPDWGEGGYYKLDKQSNCIAKGGIGYTLEAFNHLNKKAFRPNRHHPSHSKGSAVEEKKSPRYDGGGGVSKKKKPAQANSDDFVGMYHYTSYDDEPGSHGPAVINPEHQHYVQHIDHDYLRRMDEQTADLFHYDPEADKPPPGPKYVEQDHYEPYDWENGRFDLFSGLKYSV